MKTAIIKQMYDAQGPWQSVKWQDTTPMKIFDIWPGTITFWGLSCLLKPDWYVVKQGELKSDYVEDILRNPIRTKIMEKYTTNLTDIKDIPLDDYDLVITLDPILEIPKRTKTLFAYFVPEHWDGLYSGSISKPMGNFDLFLAVMLDSNPNLIEIPQSVSFPYPCDYKTTRLIFGTEEKKEAVFAEWRLLCAMGMVKSWAESSEGAVKRLENLVKMPVFHTGSFNKNPMGISDPPLWGDAVNYLKTISQCKYYIAVGRYSGPGQGIREAASLGCICIGEKDKVYHRMICHPKCLCSDMVEMPIVLKNLISSPDLQKEALKYQDNALEQKFAKEPLALLQKAVEIKRQNFK